jgi:hypothetical protein
MWQSDIFCIKYLVMEITSDIDVVYDISEKEFNETYFKPQRPVVIKGLLDKQIAGQKWTKDYFKSTMGEIMVDVYDNSIKTDGSAYTSADLKMRFDDFLNVIEKDEHTDLRMFLFNLFKYNPVLKKEFPCPNIFKGLLDNYGLTFFAGKDTTIRIHYDLDMSNVLHTQVYGRKRVVLISPEYNELLYRLPLNTYSLADINNPDYEKYPGLKYVRGSECILETGDSVFMPSGYWHLMNYITGGMSVAYRKIPYSNKTKAEGLLNLLVYLPIDKLLISVKGNQWQKIKEITASKRANKLIFDRQSFEIS